MNNKILVVEDSKTFSNYLKTQLTQIGYDVVIKETLADTQALFEGTADPLFFCTILDYCLPDAEDGEVIDFILSKEQRVVVLTATFNDQLREDLLDKGVIDYILKDSMASVSYLIPMMTRLLNNQQHHALVVDDSQTARHYLAQLLEYQYIKTTTAKDGNDALLKLQENSDISLIVSDHDMPEKDGITLIRELRQHYTHTELMVLGISALEDNAMTARFLKAGANDYLHKPFNQEEFYCRINQLLNIYEANKKLFRLANQDELTGLWNRRYFFNQPDNCAGCTAQHIAMLDIDFFKKINDKHGHAAGDKVLQTVGQLLQQHFPQPSALVARLGGEEFCIRYCGEYQSFVERLETLRLEIESSQCVYVDTVLNVTMSIGVTEGNGESIDALVTQADHRLYNAKHNGRNQVCFSENIT
ncbi:GGDEF domain-containing response regulator [Vibrio palustris]|uniref:diguanylate cyclase n=1 Tax=Vibrio palustris TaxID=1918946 RepID=A0A1R4AZW3_9VIBR|nr:diguanylate cyclase [Vibrio palustris]SJL82216.1 Response regulator PleD [Vibrio palustris]